MIWLRNRACIHAAIGDRLLPVDMRPIEPSVGGLHGVHSYPRAVDAFAASYTDADGFVAATRI